MCPLVTYHVVHFNYTKPWGLFDLVLGFRLTDHMHVLWYKYETTGSALMISASSGHACIISSLLIPSVYTASITLLQLKKTRNQP